MTDQTEYKKPAIHPIIFLPFFVGLTLIIIGWIIIDYIFLDPGLDIGANLQNTSVIALIHIILIIILLKFGIVRFTLPQTQAKRILSIVLQLLFLFISNFALELGLWLNLNYSLKNSTEKNIELVVKEKSVNRGKGAKTYFINFTTGSLVLKKKVSRKEYPNISVGDKYAATVQEGYFDGYFLTKPLNKIKN